MRSLGKGVQIVDFVGTDQKQAHQWTGVRMTKFKTNPRHPARATMAKVRNR
jgi:hypothetical protein